MKQNIYWIISISVCLIFIGFLQARIETDLEDNDVSSLLFVPDIKVLHGLTLGDDAVAADLLWLRSIFYIASFHDHAEHATKENHSDHYHDSDHKNIDGEQEFADVDLGQNAGVKNLLFSDEHRNEAVHLSRLLNIVTDLDSTFVTPYFEGALNLGLVFGRYDEALDLLSKGIIAVPNRWEMYYYRGFIKLFYLNDKIGASDDMIEAAAKPNAPPIIVQQAAAIKVGLGQTEMVIEFLRTLYETTESDDMREKIENMLAVYDYGKPKAPVKKKDIGSSLDSLLREL